MERGRLLARNEKSVTHRRRPATLRIELVAADGKVDRAQGRHQGAGGRDRRRRPSCAQRALRRVPRRADRRRPKAQGVLFSLHLKATMMKVSDPIIFGHAVRVFFADVFTKHARRAGRSSASTPNNGLGALCTDARRAARRPRAAIESGIEADLRTAPAARDGGLRHGHHQPARAERRDRRRLDAGRDPHVGPACGTPHGEPQDTKARDPGLAATPASIRAVIDDCRQARRLRPVDDGQRAATSA